MIDFEDYDEDLYDEHWITTDPGQGPVRLDKFLGDRMHGVSRNKIQNAIHAGAIQVNDEQVKPNYKVRPADRIRVLMPRKVEGTDEVQPENLPLDILYEDDDVLIVNKAPGMVVHPGIGNRSGTLVNALAYYLRSRDLPVMDGNPEDRPGLVHRIDKDTSGLLVIAKNDFAMTHLARQFFDHTIERTYVSLVWGAPEPPEGTIEGHIGRHPRQRLLMTVFPEGDEGKEAITHFRVLEDLYYVSLIECRLETGRTHQIRVHMKHLGHPVFNDERYGGDRIMKGTVFTKYKQFVQNCFELIRRHALHAKSLGFVHPRTGERLQFESPLPEDMQQVLGKWRSYVASRKEL
ncbi:MAG: RluA family pseudouridine synthase [Saprospiraceae bacterium]|nr:RluA family pseudouridine synthase [Saprospiraceae bacterium]